MDRIENQPVEGARRACSNAGVSARRACALTTLALATLALTGCSVIGKHESPLPRSGPTMAEVYRNHMNDGGADGAGATPRDRLPARGADEDAVIAQRRSLSEPLNNRFERLPNPDLTLHVFPHLAQGRYPVPGYDTVFPMYETIQYAMPGEVAPRHRDGDSLVYPVPKTGRLAAPDDKAIADAQRKRERLSVLERMSPHAATALGDYDRLYTQRCGSVLSAEQLLAVPANRPAAFDQLMGYAAAGLPMPVAESVECETAPPRAAAAAASEQPASIASTSRGEIR